MTINKGGYKRLRKTKEGLAASDVTVSDRTRKKGISELNFKSFSHTGKRISRTGMKLRRGWEKKKLYKIREQQCIDCTKLCKQWDNPEVSFTCLVAIKKEAR